MQYTIKQTLEGFIVNITEESGLPIVSGANVKFKTLASAKSFINSYREKYKKEVNNIIEQGYF